jgi:hypothetical protein
VVAPPLIDLGRKVSVSVKKATAEDIRLTLSDGTNLILRPIVAGIERSIEKYNPSGEPIYQINVALIVQTEVSKKLKRKIK